MSDSFFYHTMMLGHLREKLNRLPLRGILIFFVTLLIVGYIRIGSLAAIWVGGWIAFIAAKMAITVKKKVDLRSSQQSSANN